MESIVTREEHPLPAVVMHWLHLASFFTLAFTGFYIHGPFFAGAMGAARQLHFVAMSVFVLTTVVRVYWAFAGAGSATAGERTRTPDWRHFGREPAFRGAAWQTVRYYLFLRPTHPATGKYNPLQKTAYVAMLPLVAWMALTGLAIWTPTASTLSGLTYAAGGLVVMRVAHYLGMWVLLVVVAVHVYLVVAEAPHQLFAMLFGVESGPAPEAPLGRASSRRT
jgi:Ni/Fe-hydrogenase 1 B-type cytochrome subunit